MGLWRGGGSKGVADPTAHLTWYQPLAVLGRAPSRCLLPAVENMCSRLHAGGVTAPVLPGVSLWG